MLATLALLLHAAGVARDRWSQAILAWLPPTSDVSSHSPAPNRPFTGRY
jgi:hypothetical protein